MNRRMSRPSLFLLELTAAVLVFIVCAAVCVGLFARSRQLAKESADLTNAVFWAESAAETFKAAGDAAFGERFDADQENGAWVVLYDRDWQKSGEPVYRLTLSARRDGALELADVRVTGEDGELYRLSAARYAPEVAAHG